MSTIRYQISFTQKIVLDVKDENISKIFAFIEEAHRNCESVLISSLRGQSRSLTVVTAYIMKKYSKSINFKGINGRSTRL